MSFTNRWLLVTLGVAMHTSSFAQDLQTLGTRAAGLSAFVAVADDASAVAWNPAGLVSGPIFNAVIDLGRLRSQPEEGPQHFDTASSQQNVLVAIGTTPTGIAYYRLTAKGLVVTRPRPATPAVTGSSGRQDTQAEVQIRKLVTNHLGATVQQSVGNYVTLGATLKLVRGSVSLASGSARTWDDAFDIDRMDPRASTRGDLDAGVMIAAGRVRGGLVARNLTAPAFGEEEDGTRMALKRHVRVGVAWGDAWPGNSRVIVAVDADLTRVVTVPPLVSAQGDVTARERRDLTAGVESWWRERRVGVRGGVRASTYGATRPVVTAGGSIAVRTGMFVDGYVARGSEDERGWGLALRVTY